MVLVQHSHDNNMEPFTNDNTPLMHQTTDKPNLRALFWALKSKGQLWYGEKNGRLLCPTLVCDLIAVTKRVENSFREQHCGSFHSHHYSLNIHSNRRLFFKDKCLEGPPS